MNRHAVTLGLFFSMFALVAFAQEGRGAGGKPGDKGQKNPNGQPQNEQPQNERPQNGQQQNGQPPMMGNGGLPNGFDPNAFAQTMLTQFDKDGDAKLDQAELSQCLNALAQQVHQQMGAAAGQQGNMGRGFGTGDPRFGNGQGGQGGQPGQGGVGGRGRAGGAGGNGARGGAGGQGGGGGRGGAGGQGGGRGQ